MGGPIACCRWHRAGAVHRGRRDHGAAARLYEEVTEDTGNGLDDFPRDEGLLDDAEAVATKRVIAFQIAREMERCHLNKSELSRRMKTSRPAVERLLDSANPWVTLSTLERAASAVGKRLKVELTA